MNECIFDLVYSDFDWTEHYYFKGPPGATRQDFEKTCEKLLPQAGYRTVLERSRSQEGWISWNHVVESLVSLLEEQGYQRVKLPAYNVGVSGIIGLNSRPELNESLGFAHKPILEYNYKLEQKMKEEREQRAKKIGRLRKRTPQIMK